MSQNDNSKRIIEIESKDEGYPPLDIHNEKLLVVVKTSPNPSVGHTETVCTVVLTENGKWIRIYPLQFRYLNYPQRFSKYQWITASIKKRPEAKDFRIDSYEPEIKSIRPTSNILPAGKWEERKRLIIPTVSKSVHELADDYKKYKISLGIVKPTKMIDFVAEAGETEWSPKHNAVLNQLKIFEESPKDLEKIPFKFSYVFECNDQRCKSHKMQILDWELTELYRKMRDKYGEYSQDIILEKMKHEWFEVMWNDKRDSYLILGTTYPNPTFNVLGVFWPPKE